MRKRLSIRIVQTAFSHAIKRRDGYCRIQDFEPCCGSLECSHFFTQGSSPALMFYPPNAYAQCSLHHWNHHNKREYSEVYRHFLEENSRSELEYMERARSGYIKYTEELKLEIVKLCNSDRLDELTVLIRREIGI